MKIPNICLTLCGAALPVLLLAALTVARVVKRDPEYITVQDVPDGNPENL